MGEHLGSIGGRSLTLLLAGKILQAEMVLRVGGGEITSVFLAEFDSVVNRRCWRGWTRLWALSEKRNTKSCMNDDGYQDDCGATRPNAVSSCA